MNYILLYATSKAYVTPKPVVHKLAIIYEWWDNIMHVNIVLTNLITNLKKNSVYIEVDNHFGFNRKGNFR